jgi:hypothetical protein
MSDRREIEWPPPQPDPDREPSHPGALSHDADEGWWERWLEERDRIRWFVFLEEHRGADS